MYDPLAPLLADGVIDEVLSRLKSGKEADLWLVRHKGEVVAAKVYKERKSRSFKNDSAYKEGRQVRNSRTQRAMDKGSRFGQAAAEEAWKSKEADALHALHAAGVRVPRPVIFYEGVLLMELVLDPEGHPAPRLIDAHVTDEHARPLYEDLRVQAVRMLCCDLIHGDLSPYNVLAGRDGPVVIDFPQVIGAAHNSQAERFFQRDLDNLRRFFESFDHSLRSNSGDAREIWRAYQRRELTPEFAPSGRPPKEEPRQARQERGGAEHRRPDQRRPQDGRPRDERPTHERPQGGRPPRDQAPGGRPPHGRPQDGHPAQPHPVGGPPQHGRPHGGRPEQARPPEGRPHQDRPPHDRPPLDRAPHDRPQRDRPRDGRPGESRPPQGQRPGPPQGQPRQGSPRGQGGGHGQPPQGGQGGRRPPDHTPRREPPAPEVVKVVRPPAASPAPPHQGRPAHPRGRPAGEGGESQRPAQGGGPRPGQGGGQRPAQGGGQRPGQGGGPRPGQGGGQRPAQGGGQRPGQGGGHGRRRG
ncbi:MAG: hypothetical protein IPO09_10670 [Anaeromyxobacter sp.]|nr:hypothetical protein [Anaeromyxobacter sp.]